MSTGLSRQPSSVIVIDDDDEKEAVPDSAKSLPVTGSRANVAPGIRAAAAAQSKDNTQPLLQAQLVVHNLQRKMLLARSGLKALEDSLVDNLARAKRGQAAGPARGNGSLGPPKHGGGRFGCGGGEDS
jgi:hypothetical protein